MATAIDPSKLVLLGAVTGVRGLRGEIRIKSFTADPQDLTAYGPLWNETGTEKYRVKIIGQAKGLLTARIKGIGDRTAAEALKGLKLHIERSALPAPQEDEFYYTDLVGLKAVTLGGEDLGTVSAAEDYGAGDVLEITGGPYKGLVIPFTKAVVPVVDLAGGQVKIDPPAGLLEPPDDEAKGDEAPNDEGNPV